MSLSILLVDDIEINRKVAALMLKKLGFQADIVTNGIEAIEALKHKSYDIVLMDIQMPEMDGIEATKIIRQRWLNGPRVIVTTAQNISREACLDAGADDFLTKPLRIEKLRVAIEYNMPIPPFTTNFEYFSATCAMKASPDYVIMHSEMTGWPNC